MEGPSLNQHEIIKFLTLKGGRCTNFELVSNFRGELNHPQHQAEARLKFKDIVNTVAAVGEYQNIKYIELKQEYRDNNLISDTTSSQPSSLSSDGGSSYSSPLTQSFQPYWRYRLSTSPKVPALLIRNIDHDSFSKQQNADSSTPPHLERSVSESTLPPPVSDIQPPPRTRGRSASGYNRSASTSISERVESQDYVARRSSINGYPPSQIAADFNNHSNAEFIPHTRNSNQPESMKVNLRRHSEVYIPERPARSPWPPSSRRDLNRAEHSTLSHSQSFSGSHSNVRPNPNLVGTQYNSSSNLEKGRGERPLHCRNGLERSPKRSGICNDDMLRELEEDSSQQYMDNPVSKSFDRMHGISNDNRNISNQEKKDNHYSSLHDYSYDYDHADKLKYQNPNNYKNENVSAVINDEFLRIERENVTHEVKPVNRNLFPNSNQGSRSFESADTLQDSSLNNDNVSISSSNYEIACNSNSENKISRTIMQNNRTADGDKQSEESISNSPDPMPVPPERRRKHSKSTADHLKQNGVPQQSEELSNSTGKVKDRVQHFDDLEKKRSHHPRRGHSSPLPDKENIRGSKTSLMEDDVSISVLDPKLKKEWFVKAAQGDYYALVGLLKREPKLAAIKDIASGFTALHWAAKHGDANIVKLIAGTYRVNPNTRSNGGYTAIHVATMYKHTLIVDLLVHTYGADASIRDYSGKKASQYPDNYVRTVAGLKATERRPLKTRPPEKEPTTVSAFMRIGSLNLRKSRKSAVFASVRGRNWGPASELRLNNYKSTRKKHSKMILPEKKSDIDCKNDSDSDSAYGFYSK